MMDNLEAIRRYDERINEPRQYGVNDCAIAVSDVLLKPWGFDLMSPFGRRYRTQAGFLRGFKRVGCNTLAEAVEYAAKAAGAVSLQEGEAFQDWDLGIVFAGYAGQVVELPAFYFDGAFRGMTPDGFVVSLEGLMAWRLP